MSERDSEIAGERVRASFQALREKVAASRRDDARLLEFARDRASQLHWEAVGDDDTGTSGHMGNMHDCPHPDCRLVRESPPAGDDARLRALLVECANALEWRFACAELVDRVKAALAADPAQTTEDR